jgi:hypothetical protein
MGTYRKLHSQILFQLRQDARKDMAEAAHRSRLYGFRQPLTRAAIGAVVAWQLQVARHAL